MTWKKTPTVWLLGGMAVGALIGFALAAAYLEYRAPGLLASNSPDSDAGFALLMLGGFLAMPCAGMGAALVEILYRRREKGKRPADDLRDERPL